MIIRKIKKRDVNSIYNLASRQFRGERWLTESFLADTINCRGIHYGAFKDKKLVGAILVKLDDRPRAWIYFFDVDRKFRRRGIGNKLLCKVEKELPKNYFLILVDFEKKDTEAKEFYKDHGFKKKAKINDWFGKNRLGLIYAREIRRPKKN